MWHNWILLGFLAADFSATVAAAAVWSHDSDGSSRSRLERRRTPGYDPRKARPRTRITHMSDSLRSGPVRFFRG